MKKRRSGYETYRSWARKYGSRELLSESEYEDAKDILRLELREAGLGTTNLSRTVASRQAFDYGYHTGRAIQRAYKSYYGADISISAARNISRELTTSEPFWELVSNEYSELREQGLSARSAKRKISQTIFGSP